MLRKLWAVIKGIIFLAGLVGLITLPEDTEKWAEVMGPFAEYLSLDRVEFALYAAIIVFGLWILLPGLTALLAEFRRFFKQHDRRRFNARPPHETDQRPETIQEKGIQLFSDRGELNQARSLSEQLAKASHVYAFWTTGAKAFDEGKELHRIKRLILPNPDGNYLERYRTSYQSATDLGKSIREVTKEATNRGIPVRWYDDFIGYSLMIGDPDMNHGWAQIEMAFPCMPKGDHPSITIEKAAYPKIIANLALMLDRVWDSSKPPVDK